MNVKLKRNGGWWSSKDGKIQLCDGNGVYPGISDCYIISRRRKNITLSLSKKPKAGYVKVVIRKISVPFAGKHFLNNYDITIKEFDITNHPILGNTARLIIEKMGSQTFYAQIYL